MIIKKFSTSDFENLEFSKCDLYMVRDFLEIINNETLGRKVNNAIDQRKQGHFNNAVSNITEVNRNQVLAIRGIQTILDESNDRDRVNVIFEKYRQTFPFQIGLTNGEEVLNLLDQLESIFENRLPTIRKELHQSESKINTLVEEYTFLTERMKGRISDKELAEMKEKIIELSETVFSNKREILSILINFIMEKDFSLDANKKLKLIKCFYLILTSSIETLDAKMVKV